jgi:hypothetical protein
MSSGSAIAFEVLKALRGREIRSRTKVYRVSPQWGGTA